MRPWITRSLAWAGNHSAHLFRKSPRALAAVVRHHHGGLVFESLPVPWNSELVEVELLCRLPEHSRRRLDFSLHIPEQPPLLPDVMTADENGPHRLLFRFAPPSRSVSAEFCYRLRRLFAVHLPILGAARFTASVRLIHATLAAQLGTMSLPARQFLARQCRGLSASILLTSPTPLAPLGQGDLRVLFRHEYTSQEVSVPIVLSREQQRSREALVTAFLPKPSTFLGPWVAIWVVNGEVKAALRTEGIRLREFHESLRVQDSKFVVADSQGRIRIERQIPPLDSISRLGPCFLISSGEVGTAGRCRLSLFATTSDGQSPTRLAEQSVLMTDAGTAFAPILLEPGRLMRCTGFELRHRSRVLATLSVSPIPRASFNAEGAYKPPQEFLWSAAAEDELNERLLRLMKDAD